MQKCGDAGKGCGFSLEKVKNACFGAKTSLPRFCQGFAQESLSTTDDFSEAERQFDCTDALLKISEAQAKQEVKQAKLNAMLVKQQLQKGDWGQPYHPRAHGA